MNYKRAYQSHRSNAKRRGIEWQFTFETWLKFWNDSGHIEERGLKNNGYVMSRFNDVGPYSVDNCEIIRSSENIQQKQVVEKRKKTERSRPVDWQRRDDYRHLKDRKNHPRAKAVIAPNGDEYASAALAGDALGYTRARISQMCREACNGWKYK